MGDPITPPRPEPTQPDEPLPMPDDDPFPAPPKPPSKEPLPDGPKIETTLMMSSGRVTVAGSGCADKRAICASHEA